jgi:hypothetical protein
MPVPDSALVDLPPLTYAELRAQVRTGDIAICSGTQLFSRAIRWATGSPWSHVALILRIEEFDRVFVLEAVERIGVRTLPLSRFVIEDSARNRPYPGDIVIARHNDFAARADGTGITRMVEYATDRLGAPFSAFEMVRIAGRLVAGRFGTSLPRMLDNDNEYICSEYVACCLRQVGIDVPWDHHGFIGPADFARDPAINPVARVSRDPFPGGLPGAVAS